MKTHTYTPGKVDYNGSGRRNCKVTIEWELKAGRFSMMGNIWNPRGTDIYSGGQNLDEIARLFPHNKKVQRMVEVWREWHLNDMHAGCKHQRSEKWHEVRIPKDELPNSKANRDERGIYAIWVYPSESTDRWASEKHPQGLLTKPCPTCGYKYGSAWLREELPPEIVAEIKSWSETETVQS